tara:strand:- start:6513 stop:6689 length:177 start_codon:yes stop_codon:yes gene_type:complete
MDSFEERLLVRLAQLSASRNSPLPPPPPMSLYVLTALAVVAIVALRAPRGKIPRSETR